MGMWKLKTIFIETIKLCRLNKPFLAIPFVVTVACILSRGIPDIEKLIWNLLAVVSGFMIGNIINGIADKKFDKINPRTMTRPLVVGTLSFRYCMALIALLLFVLIYSTYRLNFFYLFLLPIPVSLIFIYSFLKRYTWLCHICMGLLNAAVAFSSWGIFGRWTDFRGVLMGAIVFFWTLGFETIYSCQDVEYDRMCGLHSIPSRFGVDSAKLLSDAAHLIMVLLLILMAVISDVGYIIYCGIGIAVLIIAYQHIIMHRNYEKINIVLDINQIFSLTLMIFSLADSLI